MDKFNVYLHFPTQNIQVKSVQEGESLLEQITMLIDRADCEKGAKLYYEGSNIDSFLKILLDELRLVGEIELEGLSFGTLSFEDSLWQLLRDALAENWEEKPNFEAKHIYKIWDLGSEQVYADFPAVFKEILEKGMPHSEQEKCLLINILGTLFSFSHDYTKKFVPVLKDVRNDINYPILRPIYFVGNFIDLEKWFVANRTPRSYNLSDFRHIEGHPDYMGEKFRRPAKSPVLGGLAGIPHIASLLETAITDQREPERASKDLINFDEVNNCYVWFEYEGNNLQNQYHGYHLVKPKTHETDTEAVAKIPQRVIALLAYRLFESQERR